MACRNDCHVPRTEFFFGPIVHSDSCASGQDVPEVRGLTTGGVRERLDIRGPAPAWLSGDAQHRQLAEVDDVGSCRASRPLLIRGIKGPPRRAVTELLLRPERVRQALHANHTNGAR